MTARAAGPELDRPTFPYRIREYTDGMGATWFQIYTRERFLGLVPYWHCVNEDHMFLHAVPQTFGTRDEALEACARITRRRLGATTVATTDIEVMA